LQKSGNPNPIPRESGPRRRPLDIYETAFYALQHGFTTSFLGRRELGMRNFYFATLNLIKNL